MMPAPGTLADRLRALCPQASGRSLKQWLAVGRVRVDGVVVRDGRAAVSAGATVELGRGAGRRALPPDLRIVHEDDDVLVFDKPAGLLTIATERERERTAYRMLWDHLAGQTPPRRPFVVHRLDRETSGLVVLAKSVAAKRKLQAQFKARTVERLYIALVEGRVRADAGTLTARLVEDRSLRVRPARPGGGSGAGKEAITHYRVLDRRPDTTLLEVSLGTGRRRQIRVQLAALGHPIVGDTEHGGRRAGRLRLHATRLGFVHPATNRHVRFDSPPPPELRGTRNGPQSARPHHPAEDTARIVHPAATSPGQSAPRTAPPGSPTRQNTSPGPFTARTAPPGSPARQNTSPGSFTPRNAPPGRPTGQNVSSASFTPRKPPPGSPARQNTSPQSFTPRNAPPGQPTAQNRSPGSFTPRKPPPGSPARQNTSRGSFTPRKPHPRSSARWKTPPRTL
jgi:23S rRNA pseudouridine1911/1915/1917 synthase